MHLKTRTVLTALILAVAACAGTDTNKTGSDVTDLTAATYTVASSASVGVTPGTSAIKVGEALKLSPTFVDEDGRGFVGARAVLVKWTSSDSTIAIVSTSGLVHGIHDGVVTITATSGKQTAASVVTVGTGHDTTAATTAPEQTTPSAPVPAASAPAAATPPAAIPPATTPPAAVPPLPVAAPPSAAVPSAPTPPAATSPAPAAPAPAPSSSTGPGLSGMSVVYDDFTKYSSTAELLANITSLAGGTGDWRTAFYIGGVNGNLVEIDKTVLYNGHATMKYNQPGGTASTPQLHVYFPARSHIWYRVKVRFSPGFTTKGTLVNSSNAYKLISWGWDGVDGSGRIEITNTTGYELYENVQSGPSLIGGGSYLMGGSITTEWSDGGWYDYVVEVDHSQATGVIRLWRGKDGQALAYQGQTIEKMNNGSSMPALTNIGVGLNFNQVRAVGQDQAVWWGQWEVVDGTQHPNPFGLSH